MREGCAPGGPGRRRAWRMRKDRAERLRGGGPARLGTVVPCPTARAARPGAQRRDTPSPRRFPPFGPPATLLYDSPCSSLPLTTRTEPTSGCFPVIIPFTTSNSTTGRGVSLFM